MNNAVYNDHVAALSVAGGLFKALVRLNHNPIKLIRAEIETRFAPRFA